MQKNKEIDTAKIRFSIILTTYNRRKTTTRCLVSLKKALIAADVDYEVVLVDASSTDGTVEAASAVIDNLEAHVVPSSFYWAMGMRKAWEISQTKEHDYLMWLNDDVQLFEESIKDSLFLVKKLGDEAIVVGGFEDPKTGEPTYGGFNLGLGLKKLSMNRVFSDGSLKTVDAANGNLIIVPRTIDDRVGGFPKGFIHGMADNVYTLNAKRSGISSYMSLESVGSCSLNSASGTWQDKSLEAAQRLKLLRSPKGLPFAQYWKFCTTYGGFLGFVYALKPYVSLLLLAAKENLKKHLQK